MNRNIITVILLLVAASLCVAPLIRTVAADETGKGYMLLVRHETHSLYPYDGGFIYLDNGSTITFDAATGKTLPVPCEVDMYDNVSLDTALRLMDGKTENEVIGLWRNKDKIQLKHKEVQRSKVETREWTDHEWSTE